MQDNHRAEQLRTIEISELPAVAGGTTYAAPRPPSHGAPPPRSYPPSHPAAPRPDPCQSAGYGFAGHGSSGYRSGDHGFPGYEFGGHGFPGFGLFRR